jgi:hypothetical protein
MKQLLGALLAMGSLTFAIEAFAQSSTSAPLTTAVQTNPAPAAPVAQSKRYACRATAQRFQGQDRADQMQLCLAQARLDCLKQAIDQKVVGSQRREFVRTCVNE